MKGAIHFLRRKTLTESTSNEEITTIIEKMSDLLWYPKVPDRELFDFAQESHCQQWEAIKKRKNYRVNTLPRNNSQQTLLAVLVNHLILMYQGFPALQLDNKPIQLRIVEAFLNYRLAENSTYAYSWALASEALVDVKGKVHAQLQAFFDNPRSRSGSSAETSETSMELVTDEDSEGSVIYPATKARDKILSVHNPELIRMTRSRSHDAGTTESINRLNPMGMDVENDAKSDEDEADNRLTPS